MKELNADLLEKMLKVTAQFVGVVAAIVAEDEESGLEMIDCFKSPDNFIEYENDVSGLKSFVLFTAKKCVELLERN